MKSNTAIINPLDTIKKTNLAAYIELSKIAKAILKKDIMMAIEKAYMSRDISGYTVYYVEDNAKEILAKTLKVRTPHIYVDTYFIVSEDLEHAAVYVTDQEDIVVSRRNFFVKGQVERILEAFNGYLLLTNHFEVCCYGL